MRKVSIRCFQQNLFSEIKDLPLTVTRKGVDAFTIFPSDVVTQDVVARQTPVNPEPPVATTVQDFPIPEPESNVTTSKYVDEDGRPECGICYQNKPILWTLNKKPVCGFCFSKMSVSDKNKCKMNS